MPGATGRSGGDRKTQGMDLFPRDGVPSIPASLTKEQQDVWRALLDQLPDEMLRGVDCYQLASLCRAICDAAHCHRLWTNSADLAYLRACRQAEAQIDRLSARFGLTPRDRQAIKFEKQIEDDATEWMNEG